MKTKIFCLALALLTVCGVFFGCGGGGDSKVTTDLQTGDDPAGIPYELRFDGDTFRFLTSPRSGDAYCEVYLDFEENVTETINDAVCSRNRMVEERFGVKLEVEHLSAYYNCISDISRLNEANEKYYDAAYISGAYVGPAALENNFQDLNDLYYVDFQKDYWDTNCYDALTLGEHCFLMISDISMSTLSGAHATYFNKQMLADNNIDVDIYQLVRDNEWTFDKMLSMMKTVTRENGDGIRDENDTYGLFNLNMCNVLNSFGFSFTTKDEDNYPVLFELNEGLLNTFDDLNAVNLDKNLQFDPVTMLSSSVDASGDGHVWNWTRSHMFTNDQILFMYDGFAVTDLLRDMVSDYGIVPNAKLREDAPYECATDRYTDFLCVPVINDDFEFTGAILEYMACVSTDTIRYGYVETVLKNKRNRDDDTKEMVDIIVKSLHYEPSDIYGLGIRDMVSDAVQTNSLATQYAKYSAAFARKINVMIAMMNSYVK